MKKGINIKKLNQVKNLEGMNTYLCNCSIKEELTKGGKNYLNMLLSDDETTLSIKFWDNDKRYEEIKNIPVESLIECALTFDGQKNGYDMYSFIEYKIIERDSLIDCVDIPSLTGELRKIISSQIKDIDIKELIFNVFKDEHLKTIIFNSPLSDNGGYSFKGGLLAHIVRQCNLCLSIVDNYNKPQFNKSKYVNSLDLSLLIGASILSDIGAGECFEIVDDVVLKTFKGKLNNPSYYSAKILLSLLNDSSMSEDKKELFEHVITSSKGQLMYGALNTPRTKEANIFQYIQRMDYVMSSFEYMDKIAFSDFAKIGDKQFCLSSFSDL